MRLITLLRLCRCRQAGYASSHRQNQEINGGCLYRWYLQISHLTKKESDNIDMHTAQFKTSWVFWCHGLSHRFLVTTQNLSSNTAKLKNLANENHRPMMGPSQGCQPVASTAETGMRMPRRGATVWDVSPTRCALTIICEF